MRRLTETGKWQDPWFRRLSHTAKLLWIYATDQCSPVGVVELDPELLSLDLGTKVESGHIKELLGERLQPLGNGRYFLPKFIPFQYGELSERCAPHRRIAQEIARHGLVRRGSAYVHPLAKLPEAGDAEEAAPPAVGEQGGPAAEQPVEPPPGFPKNEAEARLHAAFIGCPEEKAALCYHLAVSRGYRDARGVLIRNFRSYVKTSHELDLERARERQRASERNRGYNAATAAAAADGLEAKVR
jgi:hypothetical protein